MALLQKASWVLPQLKSLCASSFGALSAARTISSSSSAHAYLVETDVTNEWYLRQRTQIRLGNRAPDVAVDVWVAPNAVVVGDVDINSKASVWYGAVVRGDLNNITIGAFSNVQDRAVIHAARSSPTGLPAATKIGTFVTIEPGCLLRSVRIGDQCIIGSKSVLMEGSVVEPYAILEPGSVLPPARLVPSGEVWGGNPATFIRKVDKDEKAAIKELAYELSALAWDHICEQLPHGTAWRPVEAWRAEQIKSGNLVWADRRSLIYSKRLQAKKVADALTT